MPAGAPSPAGPTSRTPAPAPSRLTALILPLPESATKSTEPEHASARGLRKRAAPTAPTASPAAPATLPASVETSPVGYVTARMQLLPASATYTVAPSAETSTAAGDENFAAFARPSCREGRAAVRARA
jgi:hypothetical protein